ncbi:hypothetical protein K445DRAFT_368542 [Daldinia sp. EC12]|nr:hypothetical protein K445DRAFT_368542 [Daldinia sp. EC12]
MDMASASQVVKSPWESAQMPQEIHDHIARMIGRDGRAMMSRASSYFRHVFSAVHYEELRFTNTQRQLSYTLRIFIQTCENMPFTSGAGNVPFNHYISAASIECVTPPSAATPETGWEFADDSPRLGWEPDQNLPCRIMKAISLMPGLAYLSLILDHFTQDQDNEVRRRTGDIEPWKSVRLLRIKTGSLACGGKIVERLVPKLEGLRLHVGVRSEIFRVAARHHKNLQRLHIALDRPDFPTGEAPTGMPEYATGYIRQNFKHLKWLTLEFNVTRMCWFDQKSFDTKLDKFVAALKKFKHLERLAFTILDRHRLQGNKDAFCRGVIKVMSEKLPGILQIAILADYPTYYLGKRDSEGVDMDISSMDARALGHGSWPRGVRDN